MRVIDCECNHPTRARPRNAATVRATATPTQRRYSTCNRYTTRASPPGITSNVTAALRRAPTPRPPPPPPPPPPLRPRHQHAHASEQCARTIDGGRQPRAQTGARRGGGACSQRQRLDGAMSSGHDGVQRPRPRGSSLLLSPLPPPLAALMLASTGDLLRGRPRVHGDAARARGRVLLRHAAVRRRARRPRPSALSHGFLPVSGRRQWRLLSVGRALRPVAVRRRRRPHRGRGGGLCDLRRRPDCDGRRRQRRPGRSRGRPAEDAVRRRWCGRWCPLVRCDAGRRRRGLVAVLREGARVKACDAGLKVGRRWEFCVRA